MTTEEPDTDTMPYRVKYAYKEIVEVVPTTLESRARIAELLNDLHLGMLDDLY